MTVLYDYWRSSAAYRLRIALGLVGEDFDAVSVNLLTGDHKSPAHLARNPQGLVPTLDIDGQMLTQSLAILEYLEETRSPGFLPKDPAGRARVRALSYAIAMEIHPICNLSVAKYATESSGGNLSLQNWMEHFIPPGLEAIEKLLDHPATGRFCHGDTPGMADICLVPQIYNARRWGVDTTSLSRITAITANLEAIPAVQAAHPDNFKQET